jgi:phosphoserine phosphatase
MGDRASRALVLTSPPHSGALTREAIAAAASTLAGRQSVAQRGLAEGEAWEAVFSTDGDEVLSPLAVRIGEILGGSAIDINIVPGDPMSRRKRLLVADMESTIVEQEFIDEIAERAGLGDRIAAITARAMRGEIEFEAALRERVAAFADLDAAILDEVYRRATLMPGAETLIKTMKAGGAHCALVSGGFSYFTERIAAQLGFDTQQANRLEIADGKLTGRVAEPILGRAAKRAALERLTAELGLVADQTLAVGDGANDLDMIRAAGLGVAFRAKPILAVEARASIVHGDLTALLYLQGYTRDEFVL